MKTADEQQSQFYEVHERVVSEAGQDPVVLDFENLYAVYSESIKILLDLYKYARKNNLPVKIINMNKALYEAFKQMSFEKLFDLNLADDSSFLSTGRKEN